MTRQVFAVLLVLPFALGFFVNEAPHASQEAAPVCNVTLPPEIADLHDHLNAIQAKVDVTSAQDALHFAQLSQWLNGNMTLIKTHLKAAAGFVVTKAQMRKAIRKLKKDLEKKAQNSTNVTPPSNVPATPVAPKPTAVVVPKVGDSASNNTADIATQVALLQIQLASNISQINQQVQSTFANLASAIQSFQISTSNLNATVNGQVGQISYLNNRLDSFQNTINNQIMSLGSYMANNVTILSQYLGQAVFGTETNFALAKYKVNQNKVDFSQGTASGDQLVVVVPFSATFAAAPAVAVSIVSNQGDAAAAYSFYVKSVTASAATVVVSLASGPVRSTDAYSVVVIAYGS